MNVSPRIRRSSGGCESGEGGDAVVWYLLACAQRIREGKFDATGQYTTRKMKGNRVLQQKMMNMIVSFLHQHLQPFAVESVMIPQHL